MTALPRLACLLPLACLLANGTALADTLYKSVGPDGKISYGDQPPLQGRVLKTKTYEAGPSTALPSAVADRLGRLKAGKAAAPGPGGVVLYSAAWCGYCQKAKAYLAGRGIAYREVDIDTPDGLAAFAQAGSGKGVPLLVAAGQRVQGFSAAAYDALFADGK